jgi:hypothetical protein
MVNIETPIVFDSRSRNELAILKEGAEPTKASARSKKHRAVECKSDATG